MSFLGNDRVRGALAHLADLVASSQAAYALSQDQVEQRLLRAELRASAAVRASLLRDIEAALGTSSGHAAIGPNAQDTAELIARLERADQKIVSALDAAAQMVMPMSVDQLVRKMRDEITRSQRRLQACLRLVRIKHCEGDATNRGVVMLAGFDEQRTVELACELAERGFETEVASGIGEALYRVVWQEPLVMAVPEGTRSSVDDALAGDGGNTPLVIGVSKDADASTVVQHIFSQARLSASAPTVLVVEDDADLRSALAQALSDRGFAVDEAMDGRDALVKLEQGKTEVVLLDLMMPRMSGVGFLKEVQKYGRPPPVVVYSAYVEPAAQHFPNVSAVLRKTAGIDAVVDALRHSLA